MEAIVKSKDGFGKGSLGNFTEKGSEYWRMTKAKGQSLWTKSRSSRRQAWVQTKGFIRKHPAQAVGYALLWGALFAYYFRPKAKE